MVALLAALYLTNSPSAYAREPIETVRLQLKWKHQFQFAGYYAAIEKGYYRRNGFNVELLGVPLDDTNPAEVVLRGDAEFGIATSDLALLRSRGRPVVVLAPIFQHSPLILLSTIESGVISIHDLVGKPITIEAHAAELEAYLQVEGVPLSKLQNVPHTYDTKKLIDGTIVALSAYSTDEPYALKEAGIPYQTFTPRSGGIDFYGDTLFTTESQIRDHPDRVKRFLEASLLGWRYALDHPDEIIDLILTKYSKRHTREHLAFEAEMTRRLILPDVVEVGYMNEGRWRHIVNTYSRIGMVQPDMPLQGFLYERFPKPNLTRLYLIIAGILLFSIVVSIVAIRLKRLNATIHRQADSLRMASQEIKQLQGILPICAHCKKIRNDQGYWQQLESYISDHSDANFSHGICSDCYTEHYSHLKLKPKE